MRSPAIIEAELMEISAIAEDGTKLERIVSWCATHPEELPLAMRFLMGRLTPREMANETPPPSPES